MVEEIKKINTLRDSGVTPTPHPLRQLNKVQSSIKILNVTRSYPRQLALSLWGTGFPSQSR